MPIFAESVCVMTGFWGAALIKRLLCGCVVMPEINVTLGRNVEINLKITGSTIKRSIHAVASGLLSFWVCGR